MKWERGDMKFLEAIFGDKNVFGQFFGDTNILAISEKSIPARGGTYFLSAP